MGRARVAVVGTVACIVLASCSSGSEGGGGGSDPTTTAAGAVSYSANFRSDDELPGTYRQGVVRSGDGWVFVTNGAIYRTDSTFRQTQELQRAIPAELAAEGYDHLGDPDLHDGLLWVPVERPDKSEAEQVTARYDEETFEHVDSFTVPQHHNAFVAVDEDGVAYSTDEFSDDTIVRYRVRNGEAEVLEPIRMSRTVERIQGGDIADGALWLSTDDERNGVYRVDLETGDVTDLGSAGRIAGEGEGIDATEVDGDLLHVLVADPAIVPMWLVHLRVVERPQD